MYPAKNTVDAVGRLRVRRSRAAVDCVPDTGRERPLLRALAERTDAVEKNSRGP
ncbi:hypothetical protein [Halomicrococcus sp. NG-SE-24]|uniref:hypothetical protein n=1 Tax=Halomicrococcus sp. NG-SE-24 TaxID=3436928 RepID=UPI003D970106